LDLIYITALLLAVVLTDRACPLNTSIGNDDLTLSNITLQAATIADTYSNLQRLRLTIDLLIE